MVQRANLCAGRKGLVLWARPIGPGSMHDGPGPHGAAGETFPPAFTNGTNQTLTCSIADATFHSLARCFCEMAQAEAK